MGFKALGQGVLVGGGTLLASPVLACAGAKEEGAAGAVKGFAVGAFGGAALMIGGAVQAVTQVTRGLIHEAESQRERSGDKVYDRSTGTWVAVDLDAAQDELDRQDEQEFRTSSNSDAPPVASTALYDRLGVPSSASTATIKKAYYKMAMTCHPDKNPDDPRANERFQELGQTYAILSDPEKRQTYDRTGRVEPEEAGFDASLFFSCLFGDERFEGYIGTIQLAELGDKLNKGVPSSNTAQLRRVLRLALTLRSRLDQSVHARDEAGFAADCAREARDLAASNFGPVMLQAIGTLYRYRTGVFLEGEMAKMSVKGFFKKQGVAMQHRMHKWGSRASFAGSFMRSAVAVGGVVRAENSQDRIDDALPVFLRAAWDATRIDLDLTITEVVRKLLKDIAVPWQIRLRRAWALQVLADAFLDAAGPRPKLQTTDDVKTTIETALQAAVKKA